MNNLGFTLSPVERKPKIWHREGGLYDPIIDAFLGVDHELVVVSIEDKEAGYIRTQLERRVFQRNLGDRVGVSIVNGEVYLEKL